MKYIIIVFIFLSFSSFFYINNLNYQKIKEIKSTIVKHPEMIPKKEIAKNTSLGFSNLRADIYWLETIQYIGGNAISGDFKKYLYQMLDLITHLNPYFEKPYIIGQLLLPDYNQRYENLDEETIKKNQLNAEKLGLKGVSNFCNQKKIDLILKENNLQKIWSEEQFKNPCKSFEVPFNQRFLNYYYLKDSKEAANFYKISSVNENALLGAKTMTAIMTGKSGNRETSIFMFLTLADYYAKDNKTCQDFSNILKNYTYSIFKGGNNINSKDIKEINNLRNKFFTFDEEKEKEILQTELNCINYINKSVRELNLAYIEKADSIYFEKNKNHSENAKQLFDEKYIDYLPKDFQQYDSYGIIYFYNEEINQYDYKMGVY